MNNKMYKDILRKFCEKSGVKFPDMTQRIKLRKAYEDSLCEGFFIDCEYTLSNFLDSTNWTEIFEGKNMNNQAYSMTGVIEASPIYLAPLPITEQPPAAKAQLPAGFHFATKTCCQKEEGKTPMRYNDNYASASVNTVAVKSDAASQREYFSDRLQSAFYPKQKELEKLFNLYVDNTPPNYKQLIDAIKNDKFKVDPKAVKQLELINEDDGAEYFWGPLHGIIFDGPQRDPKGFSLAYEEMKKQKTVAQDTIVAGDAAAGLKALQDFEAWLPTPAVTTTTTSVN